MEIHKRKEINSHQSSGWRHRIVANIQASFNLSFVWLTGHEHLAKEVDGLLIQWKCTGLFASLFHSTFLPNIWQLWNLPHGANRNIISHQSKTINIKKKGAKLQIIKYPVIIDTELWAWIGHFHSTQNKMWINQPKAKSADQNKYHQIYSSSCNKTMALHHSKLKQTTLI